MKSKHTGFLLIAEETFGDVYVFGRWKRVQDSDDDYESNVKRRLKRR